MAFALRTDLYAFRTAELLRSAGNTGISIIPGLAFHLPLRKQLEFDRFPTSENPMATHSNRYSTGLLTLSLILLGGCATIGPVLPPAAPLPADIAGVLLFAALIGAGGLSVRDRNRQGAPRLHDDFALALLKERYARGEIDRETFLERLHDIESVGSRSRAS